MLTAAELRQRERDNLIRALERTGWQVAGEDGAAEAAKAVRVAQENLASAEARLGKASKAGGRIPNCSCLVYHGRLPSRVISLLIEILFVFKEG